MLAEIGGKRQDMAVDTAAVGGDRLLERPDGKTMAKVVEPRSGFAVPAPKPGSACQPDEDAGQGCGMDRLAS